MSEQGHQKTGTLGECQLSWRERGENFHEGEFDAAGEFVAIDFCKQCHISDFFCIGVATWHSLEESIESTSPRFDISHGLLS